MNNATIFVFFYEFQSLKSVIFMHLSMRTYTHTNMTMFQNSTMIYKEKKKLRIDLTMLGEDSLTDVRSPPSPI